MWRRIEWVRRAVDQHRPHWSRGAGTCVGRVSRCASGYLGHRFGRLRYPTEHLQLIHLLVEVRVVSVDTPYACNHEQHEISGAGKEQERSASLVLLRMRTGFNQVIKHRVPPLVAGAIG